MLGNILADGVDVHRCLAAQALGRIGGEDTLQPLITALLDEDEDVRTDAAEALVRLADPRAGQQLLENLLGDPCAEVKIAAIEALAKLGDNSVIPWLRRIVAGRDEEIVWDEQEFYSSGWDDWVDIQIAAVKGLAELGVGEAVPDIIAAMADEAGQDMTEVAFKALARMGEPGIQALAGILDDPSARLRRRAATALASSQIEGARDYCAGALIDTAPEVRLAALRGMAAGDAADSRLEPLLRDPDAGVRAAAITLCAVHYVDQLSVAIADDAIQVQLAGLIVIAGLSTASSDEALSDQALLAAVRDRLTGETAAAAARAFAALARGGAMAELTGMLQDVDRPEADRLGALQGLAAIGGGEAVAALVAVVDDKDRPIRLEAMSALGKLAVQDQIWPNEAGSALIAALGGCHEPDEPPEPAVAEVIPLQVPSEPALPGPAPEQTAFPTSTLNALLADVPEARETAGLPRDGVELTPMDMERLALAKRIKKSKKRMPIAPKVVRHQDIRRFAARVLGELPHGDVAQQLALALADGDGEVRMAAADSLARIGARPGTLCDDVSAAILTALGTADRDLKLLLLRALAGCPGEDAIVALRGYLVDEDSFLRSEAIRGLSNLARVGPEIDDLLGDPDPSVRLCAAEAIAMEKAERAIPALVDFALSFEGYHGKQAAGLLRELDAAAAGGLFL
ncbi:MAG: hypothetical protein HN732_02930, partial [Rhodospirillaceae bacterium]|nr:hypothetical protein [Rhodospirillaceae bacterium]